MESSTTTERRNAFDQSGDVRCDGKVGKAQASRISERPRTALHVPARERLAEIYGTGPRVWLALGYAARLAHPLLRRAGWKPGWELARAQARRER